MKTLTFTSGDHLKHFEVVEESTLNLVFKANSRGTFICDLVGEGKCDINITFEEHTQWHFLCLNKSDKSLSIDEKITLKEHADITMNYGELSLGDHHKKTLYHLVGENSTLHVKGAGLVYGSLNWDLKALHHAKRTFANLDNHALTLKNGKLKIEVTGQIDKGYSQSETHQMTRVMNLGDPLNSTVFPKLLIDENDVAASHAATMGQPNEEHIYYLQSRGISYHEALKLLMKGYLLPITSDIENEMIKKQLIEEIETKVENL